MLTATSVAHPILERRFRRYIYVPMMNDATNSSPSPRGSSIGPAETKTGGPDLRTRPLHEEISACARELWRKYGCPVGRDEAIWLEAERQILGADPQVTRVEGRATSADAINQSAISPSTASPGGGGRTKRAGQDEDAELAASAGPVTRAPRRRQTVR